MRALLVEEGRLLVNRHQGRLALFGGRVEKGETARLALERELDEELGVRVEIGPLAYVIENYFRDGRKRRIHELGLYYRVTPLAPLGAEVRARERALHPMWLPLYEVGDSALRPHALREQLKTGIAQATVELIEIDRRAFPEML